LANIFKNIQFWFSINHFDRIKTYGFYKHLKYVFNFNISELAISYQGDLSKLPTLKYPKDCAIREMDLFSIEEIKCWISLINKSYPDANETYLSFQRHLEKHPFLEIDKIFFILKLDVPVGTFTTGRYRKNNKVGGLARIAVDPEVQGLGLGFFAINYGYCHLKAAGIKQGESIIAFKRKQSIALHMKCGFVPQFNREKILFDPQKRMWPVRLIARIKLSRLYHYYLNSPKTNN